MLNYFNNKEFICILYFRFMQYIILLLFFTNKNTGVRIAIVYKFSWFKYDKILVKAG